MSIEYNCGIARGWKFTEEEINDFNEKTDYKYEDDFILLDTWSGNCGGIFGEWLKRNPEGGSAIEIGSNVCLGTIDTESWIKKFEEAGIDINTVTAPKMYLVHQVC